MLSENIKVMRKAKGLSQQELAEKLNVVRQTVSKWEQGLSVPDADMLLTLSEVFETPVSTLLGETVIIRRLGSADFINSSTAACISRRLSFCKLNLFFMRDQRGKDDRCLFSGFSDLF